MQEWSELIKAIANILWPILFIIFIFIFKNEFREILRRFKRGKLLGQELELEKSLDNLELKAKVIDSEFPLIEKIQGTDKYEIGQTQIIKQILDLTSKDLKSALLFLDAEIEKELRNFMLLSGHHNRIKNVSLGTIATYLGEIGYLTDAMVSTIHSFREIKNKIIHGSQEGTDFIHRVIDTGLTILKTLLVIPHEINIVYHPGIDIFEDQECLKKREDIKGLILETTSPGGTLKTYRIFPTRRMNYKKGKQVAWEWNMDLQFGQSWYRDPDTNEIKQAWNGSTEFIGRHLEDV